MPRNDLTDLYQVEMTERRVTLGKEMYDALVEDLADYSGTSDWDAQATYAQDALVVFEGIVYISLVDNNQTEPGTRDKWDFAKKFNTDINNTLWCYHLGRYLSLHVIDLTLPKTSTQMRGAGLIQINGENFEPADKQEVNNLHTSVKAQIFQTWENMDDWLKDNQDSFAGYKGFTATETCEKCKGDCICGAELLDLPEGSNWDTNRKPIIEYGQKRNQYGGNTYRLG